MRNMPKWLDLMRTGTFRDRHGNSYDITGDALRRIAGNHNSDSPAHLIVGHPGKKSVPSFGIVGKLREFGDRLQFQVAKAVPEFESLVKKGFFKNVSAGLDAGLTRLDHIAFLSAQAPAINGLAPIAEFSSPESDGWVELQVDGNGTPAEFSAENMLWWKMQSAGRALRRLKNYLIEKESAEIADNIIPEYTIEELTAEPPQELTAGNPMFSSSTEKGGSMDAEKMYNDLKAKYETLEGKMAEFSTQNANLTTQLANVTAERDTLAQQNADLKAANKKIEFEAYAEKLVNDKKILPDEKESTVKQLIVMDRATTAEFSEGGEGESPLALFKARLEAGSVTLPGGDHLADRRGAEFSADGDGVADGHAARKYMDEKAAAGVNVSVTEALAYVKKNRR